MQLKPGNCKKIYSITKVEPNPHRLTQEETPHAISLQDQVRVLRPNDYILGQAA